MSVPAFELNPDNYYGVDADWHYMSVSQFKSFVKCEAAGMAKIRGEWKEETSDAMLVGSYVHAAADGTLNEFRAQHPEMFTKSGELKAAFKQAERMIETLAGDALIREYMRGVKEFIVTADFAGCTWKAKLDIYDPTLNRIVDIKTVKSLTDKVWDANDRTYLSWIEGYGYIRQLAVYAELLKRWQENGVWASPYIIGVSKEEVPDKGIFSIDSGRIEAELAMVQAAMPHILAVKNGEVDPTRCERCNYCKQTKQLDRVMHFSELVV